MISLECLDRDGTCEKVHHVIFPQHTPVCKFTYTITQASVK